MLSPLVLLLLALALPAPSSASDAAARVDTIFARWKSPDTPGCAVGVGQDGRIVLTRAYGRADLERDVPNAPDTIFEAGSVSKQFTAAAVVLLAHEGKLSLDDEVRRHVPELPDYGTSITIRHLLHHTSGLRDWGTVVAAGGWPRGSRVHTHDHVLDVVSRQEAINFPPGSEYLYSNTGYNLLAIITERASGRSFADFTRERIFQPLGMTNTSWRDDYTRIVRGRAIAYAPADEGFRLQMPFENVHGNGGLLTTVEDLLRWNQNFVHATVGGPAFVEELHRRGRLTSGREIAYAEGLRVSRYRGIPEVGHSGATGGYRAHLVRYPDQRLSVAVLCNAAHANASAMARQVSDVFLPPPAPPAPPGEPDIPPESLDARAGLYRNTRTHEPLRFHVRDGRLRAEPGSELRPVTDSIFEMAGGSRLTFGGSGVILDGGEDNEDVLFERVEEWTPHRSRLADYAGEYHSGEAEVTYVITVQGDALELRRRPAATTALTPSYADVFVAEGGWLVRFLRGADGRVNGLSLGLGRVRDLRFERLR